MVLSAFITSIEKSPGRDGSRESRPGRRAHRLAERDQTCAAFHQPQIMVTAVCWVPWTTPVELSHAKYPVGRVPVKAVAPVLSVMASQLPPFRNPPKKINMSPGG